MCNSSGTMLALKPAYPTQKMVTTVFPDDSKRRRLNLKKQQEAYKTTMADRSQIYDGRNMLPHYSSISRDSDALRADLKALSSFYRPVKKSQEHRGKDYTSSSSAADTNTSPAEVSGAYVKHNCHFSPHEHSISPTTDSLSDSKAIPQTSQSDSVLTAAKTSESKPCDDATATTVSEDSESSSSLKLIRRKKSSPQHRCIDKNLKLSGIMKPPRYVPSELGDQLTSSLKITRGRKVTIDERLTKSMVEFRANVEVYCYSL
eukprot:CCRYP_015104-RA/>CCRYP_015104-RA protein AED:0.13 eAED:0.13 QI:0/-1/0/1/-1/1/1/0/259